MTEPVRIFKCPCNGKKYRLAGEPNESPNFDELKEYWKMILQGCTVTTISIEQFRDEGWEYCGGGCVTPPKTYPPQPSCGELDHVELHPPL
jgi:hypothetical protein